MNRLECAQQIERVILDAFHKRGPPFDSHDLADMSLVAELVDWIDAQFGLEPEADVRGMNVHDPPSPCYVAFFDPGSC